MLPELNACFLALMPCKHVFHLFRAEMNVFRTNHKAVPGFVVTIFLLFACFIVIFLPFLTLELLSLLCSVNALGPEIKMRIHLRSCSFCPSTQCEQYGEDSRLVG